MTRRIGLALTLHNHQPVGNFGWVIAETYDRAYLPMLEALERHPGVRLALHYTGPLLAWLRAERAGFLDRLAALVARDQVEIVGGGWYEPVLASLPERDRITQLVRMADELEAQFGIRPRGAWLAERVWEPDLPTALVDGGYQWTILDDAHFRAAAIPEEALWGPYTTDDQGKVLTVWGTEQGLRYRIPFSAVESVIDHLRDHATEAGDRVGTMGDDGEKFGAWPTTYEHCWTNGWVEDFFTALEANAGWLRTVTPSRWLDDHPPIGRVYVPTGSYAEMGEWALPPDEGITYSEVLHEAQAAGRPEVRWLRGAIWRNFQVRYREINDLHKQMLRASRIVDAMPPGPARDAATDRLLAGQSNDPYWHGLFGGIYLPDLRLANHANLIAAEDLALGGAAGETGVELDLDLDGRPEILLANAGEIVTIKPDEGAGIGRWDIRAARLALAAVLRRRPEAYHEKVRRLDAAAAAPAEAVAGAGGHAEGEDAPASIHDIVMTKQAGLAAHLRYDADERRSGLLRFLAPDVASDEAAAGVDDRGDFASGAWTVRELAADGAMLVRDGLVQSGEHAIPVRAEKTIRIEGDRLAPTVTVRTAVTNTGGEPLTARVAIEWSIMLLGGGGNPAAWQEAGGIRVAHDGRLEAGAADRMSAGNDFLGVCVATRLDPPADVWTAPIETVSNSEAGFELVYQGSAALFSRVVTLGPGETTTIAVEHTATVTPGQGFGATTGA
ncbi:MAG TPA: alpha-amylase/4-alpha-glucanotransferase domain-containing protein [Candidatus Limnocylindrales bacterium]